MKVRDAYEVRARDALPFKTRRDTRPAAVTHAAYREAKYASCSILLTSEDLAPGDGPNLHLQSQLGLICRNSRTSMAGTNRRSACSLFATGRGKTKCQTQARLTPDQPAELASMNSRASWSSAPSADTFTYLAFLTGKRLEYASPAGCGNPRPNVGAQSKRFLDSCSCRHPGTADPSRIAWRREDPETEDRHGRCP